MAGGLTEAQRGILLSSMSTESAAMMLGRSQGWVCRQRAALIDLPPRLTAQDRAAVAAKPWRPDEDAFAPLTPPLTPPVAAPVVVRRAVDDRPQTWREAGESVVRAVTPVPRPEHRPSVAPRPCAPPVAAPPRRWNDLRRAESARAADSPAALTPDPAVLSEKHHERMFVRGKRAAGVSWFNIANMTGKTVPYLKANYGEGAL